MTPKTGYDFENMTLYAILQMLLREAVREAPEQPKPKRKARAK